MCKLKTDQMHVCRVMVALGGEPIIDRDSAPLGEQIAGMKAWAATFRSPAENRDIEAGGNDTGKKTCGFPLQVFIRGLVVVIAIVDFADSIRIFAADDVQTFPQSILELSLNLLGPVPWRASHPERMVDLIVEELRLLTSDSSAISSCRFGRPRRLRAFQV